MLLDESYFETFPKEIRYNKYVLIEHKDTVAERVLCAYDSEIEAYKDLKKCSTKCNVIKANVTYLDLEGLKVLYKYEEV